MAIDPYNGVPVYRQLAAAIRGEIMAGRLSPGSQLPPEARLMHEYGVGQATVRSAMRLLRAEGLIDVVRGKIATVRELPIRTRRKVPRNAIIQFRMPTPEEVRRHHIPEGVPVAEVTKADGSVLLYVGDRDELTT